MAGGAPVPAPGRAKKSVTEELPIEERIRRRAYELYVQRGKESGSELDDWSASRRGSSESRRRSPRRRLTHLIGMLPLEAGSGLQRSQTRLPDPPLDAHQTSLRL